MDDSDDDDDVSLLSDASSDASSIDMDWLGADSDDDVGFALKTINSDWIWIFKSSIWQDRKTSSSVVRRSASSAQDMLRAWEKKARQAEAPTRKRDDVGGKSVKRVGSMRHAWENGLKTDSNGHAHSDAPKSPKRETPDYAREDGQVWIAHFLAINPDFKSKSRLDVLSKFRS